MGYCWTLLILLASHICASYNSGSSPQLALPNPEGGYRALVKENEVTVEVTPRIRLASDDGSRLCRLVLSPRHHGEIPFRAEVVSTEDDVEGRLVARHPLNCEKRKTYKFDISGVTCDGRHTPNVTVHVIVEDVNEFEPEFTQESYKVDVDEDRLYDHFLQVEATDRDCTHHFSDICSYEILTPDQPFTIDSQGRIRNTRPLSWEESRNHIFSVVAYDCGMKRSKPATVNVKVNRVCRLGWKGIHERIEYTPASGRKLLFPDAALELCDVPCRVQRLSVRLTLATHHIGKGCDRDTYSVESQRKLCGASSASVDLLPSPGVGAEWTHQLPTDDGHESDQIYEFDGSTNAVVIPEATLPHNLTNTFTLAFWMKHEPPPTADRNASLHQKEHILCNADDHKMNRHHYAVFVRNCRLIMLLRREFYQERRTVYRPAEWRWKMSEVCDNQWHHYAINVNFPEATLYVDGQPFKVQSNNPEIIDDWPLHATKGINTTMVVGACWQGKASRMAFHFRGYLAGLSVLRGQTETPEVLSCLHRCKEGLEVPSDEMLDVGTELVTNADLTEASIHGSSRANVEQLVSLMGYVNSREFPTPGRRALRLYTTLSCDSGKNVKLPAAESYVMVLPPEVLTISINGTSNLAQEYEPFKQGLELFASVSIHVNQQEDTEDGEEDSSSSSRASASSLSDRKLDSCSVQVFPPLNPDHEYFRLPVNLMTHLGIRHKDSKDGLLIYGSDTIHNYESVLRGILYFNRKPAYYLNRAFKLVCSELNGRFTSNEYVQMLTVIHPRPQVNSPEEDPSTGGEVQGETTPTTHQVPALHHAQVHAQEVELKEPHIQNLDSALLDKALVKTSAGHAVTIIIVVCAGFLVFMMVLGVIRIRAAHHRSARDSPGTGPDDQEMAWDDSALTITVNPMEQLQNAHEAKKLQEDEDDDSSDDEGSSYHDESSEEEAERTMVKARELEWDDSTLNF